MEAPGTQSELVAAVENVRRTPLCRLAQESAVEGKLSALGLAAGQGHLITFNSSI